jgi:ectoine hydroxylase-related dioxygenase (phytanoyl-CoA dioxygenase family)
MLLTANQVRAFESDGFAVGGRLLDDSQLARLKGEFDAMIAALPSGQRPENLPSVHYDNAFLRALFLSDPLVDVAEQILGPDVVLFVSYAISKRAKDGLEVRWHQDAAYWPITPMRTFTLWLAVDDSDRENGCMRVLSGSHKDRVVRDHEFDSDGRSTLPLGLDGIDEGRAVDVEIDAGGFSVHDPFILHGSNPNRSARRRCGITIKYIATDVTIDRDYVSPTKFDWHGVRLYHARGARGAHEYWN